MKRGIATGPIRLGYPIPIPANAHKIRERKRPKGKRNLFGFKMAERHLNELRALADCVGSRSDTIVYYAVVGAIFEIERQLGFTGEHALKLTKKERYRLAEKVRLVSLASLRVGLRLSRECN